MILHIIDKIFNKHKKQTQAIVFIKTEGKWQLKKIKTSFKNASDIENQIRKMKVEDFKIWLVEEINTVRYWNDINFYNPANFIYLPLSSPDDKDWTWFDMNEAIPYPKYLAYRFGPHFNMTIEENDGYIWFSFPDYSDNKYPISKENIYEINQIEIIKEFLQKLKQNNHASCTVSGIVPYTFIAWAKDNEIRFQFWTYSAEALFEYKNGMELLLELEIDKDEFYEQFEKFLKLK